ncbi:MAG: outer membrane beta-barrel protein [Thermoanaerobaculia bacterium]|nr:outer membrane beta-barrel protein [Thermoanaerobaculia bacterium]
MNYNTRILTQTSIVVLSLFAQAFGGASPAAAQAGSGTFEIYLGQFAFEEDYRETTYGLRAGYRSSNRIGIEASLGYADTDVADATFLDLSAKIYFGSEASKAQAFLFAGPGWADVDSDDVLTLNLGVGLDIRLSDRMFLRPDVRSRWFEHSEASDLEASLSLGFTFGD